MKPAMTRRMRELRELLYKVINWVIGIAFYRKSGHGFDSEKGWRACSIRSRAKISSGGRRLKEFQQRDLEVRNRFGECERCGCRGLKGKKKQR
jgi:hypothetical protein